MSVMHPLSLYFVLLFKFSLIFCFITSRHVLLSVKSRSVCDIFTNRNISIILSTLNSIKRSSICIRYAFTFFKHHFFQVHHIKQYNEREIEHPLCIHFIFKHHFVSNQGLSVIFLQIEISIILSILNSITRDRAYPLCIHFL